MISEMKKITIGNMPETAASVAPADSDLRRVDELAFADGFNSLSAFYSCFRRHTGLSPKAYLKQISLRARTQDSV